MTPELWQRLKPLFHAALEEGPENRAAFLDAACGDDLELKMHLQQLLEAEQKDTGLRDAPLVHLNDFFDDGLPDNKDDRVQSDELTAGGLRLLRPMVGQVISHYRIIAKLG